MQTQHDELEYLRTLMVLHYGSTPWQWGPLVWYIRNQTRAQHEVEIFNARNEISGRYFWSSEEDAVRAYCKFYRLGIYGDTYVPVSPDAYPQATSPAEHGAPVEG